METIVIDRIRCLWKYREWYRSHLGWIPQQQVDDRAELRYLIGLLREWRRTRPALVLEVVDHPADATWAPA